MTVKELEEKALGLGCEERARLAARLLLSLEESTESDAEKLWLDEAERRLDAYQKGAVQAIPAEEVFARVLEGIK
ncbi:hypothetical protein GMST_03410 [Geomonas silvestris]|uniref:Addiction module antitoxin RelB n=1 Tax=Geomonas silvestris TaxID=2740184 RepID=A0A6V8MDG2_9BACT|nr:addiction module protein [Geomonas silvestris]GFO58016.1 hypothetical protein GMST_03410 [Geomonas silvestris]